MSIFFGQLSEYIQKVIGVFRYGHEINEVWSYDHLIYHKEEQVTYYYTLNIVLNPDVEGAVIKLNDVEQSSITIPIIRKGKKWVLDTDTQEVALSVTADGYESVSETFAPVWTEKPTENVTVNHIVEMTAATTYVTLTVSTTPDNASVVFTYPEGTSVTISGKTITVPTGTTVGYTVSLSGYYASTGEAVMKTDKTVSVSLSKIPVNYTVTINYTPQVAATITTNNSSLTVTRTGGNTSSGTITAKEGTTCRVFVTPTSTSYNSNYMDITFDKSKSVTIALTSNVKYWAYTVSDSSGNTYYYYTSPNPTSGMPLYMCTAGRGTKVDNWYYVARNAATSSSQLVQAVWLNLNASTWDSRAYSVNSYSNGALRARPAGMGNASAYDIICGRNSQYDLLT